MALGLVKKLLETHSQRQVVNYESTSNYSTALKTFIANPYKNSDRTRTQVFTVEATCGFTSGPLKKGAFCGT